MKKKNTIIPAAFLILALAAGGCGSSGSPENAASSGQSDQSSIASESTAVSSESVTGVSSSSGEGVTLSLGENVSSPDLFLWSGGSGRVTMDCDQISEDGGETLANLIFESSHYQYVKEDGVTYYGTHENGTSAFVIPIKLNANTEISALTTAMSQPHEIDYTLYVGKTDGSSNTVLTQYDTLDEEAPAIPGLTAEETQPEAAASYLRIYQYDSDVTLLEIDTHTGRDDSDDTAETAAPDNTVDADSETSAAGSSSGKSETGRLSSTLYTGNIVKYLIAPEDTELAAGLEKHLVLIRKPVEKVYLADSDAEQLLNDLSLSDKIADEGSADEIPEYKSLIRDKIDLVIQNASILSSGDADKLGSNMAELDIPLLLNRSGDESADAAKEAWKTAYETIFHS